MRFSIRLFFNLIKNVEKAIRLNFYHSPKQSTSLPFIDATIDIPKHNEETIIQDQFQELCFDCIVIWLDILECFCFNLH